MTTPSVSSTPTPPPRRLFPGSRVRPNDPRYPALVRGFNQRFVGTPRYVQVCGSVPQVRQAVQRAVDAGHRITVRGGGHCYEDFVSGNHGGVIIDLSPLQAVYRAGVRYCIEGGCTLWNVYSTLDKEYGVTMPAGSCYSVGAGGHIVGGGYGLLSRKYGLTIDYLDAIELVYVTEAGRAEVITVGRDSTDPAEQDLFWAHLGGGGGNFGVVTKYWMAGLPPAPGWAYLTTVAWDWQEISKEQFTALVTNYGQFLEQNSAVDSPYKDLFSLLHLTRKTPGNQIVLTVQYVGEQPDLITRFLEAVEPDGLTRRPQRVPVGYHHVAAPTTTTRRMPWLEATQTLNGSGANQRGKYKSAYMCRAFPEEQIATMWEFLARKHYTNSQALLQVDSYGCQVNAVASDATAIPQRSSVMKLQYQTYWTEAGDDTTNLTWIRHFYKAMYGPDGPVPDGIMDGCYVNYPDADLENWATLYYKDNYPRLQQAKARWDPRNIFHHRQSIQLPTGATRGTAS